MATEEAVAVAVVSKMGEYLIGQIGSQFGYLIHYKSNIKNLKNEIQKLKEKRDGLQLTVDEATGNGDIIGPDVQGWLDRVDELYLNATNLYEGEVKENNGCLKGWCPNLKACYILSKKAKKKTEEAAEFQKGGFTRISYRAPPLAIGSTTMADFKSFHSREPTINDIVKYFKGDEVLMIGICGMGGLGKTTMVEEIVRRVRAENLFDEVVMAVVSQNPDSMKIQDEIAYRLCMELTGKTSLTVRADCLQNRLKQSNKGNLVILDDVWGSLDLKEIGIPYGGENNKCKILFTSRSEDVCKVMGCGKIFNIEVLPEQEAWSLFRDMVGDCVDAPDLYLTASKVAKECGGLPIALITLGKALKDKNKEVWDDALVQLTKSIIPTNLSEVEAKVHRSLQLSYDHLEGNEAKSLFLLCCLFPEDTNIRLEDLVRYGVGLRLFDGIDLVKQARDRVAALTKKLKSCFLLLNGKKRNEVKLHDVVRDVGISIASKENHFNMKMKMIHGGGWPMARDDVYKDCTALSVISNKISDLPLEGLDCPNLEVLQLTCCNLSQKALNRRNVFAGMPRLRVLDMGNTRLDSLPSSVQLLKQLRVLQINNTNRDMEIRDLLKELGNLEILSVGFLPKNVECLTNLRLLDLRLCGSRILFPPSVFSCLQALEDLHTGTWVPAEEGGKSGNASISDLESLSKLTSLVVCIPHARFLPKNHFLEKLERYIICVGNMYYEFRPLYDCINWFLKKMLFLDFSCIDDAPLGGGIDYLLKQSTESLKFGGYGLKIVFDTLFHLGGSAHLRKLHICRCNERAEYLVDTSRAEMGVFPKLEKMILDDVRHLKEICHGQKLPEGSFRSLQKVELTNLHALTHLWEYENVKLSNLQAIKLSFCYALKHLFTLSVAKSLVNLQSIEIQGCSNIEEVIINEINVADIQIIEFPKLRKLSLEKLQWLTCFSKGIDHINLPQLAHLHIENLPNLKSFPLEGNTKVALENNHTVQLQPFFNDKVQLSNLEILHLVHQNRMTDIWNDQLEGDSFHKLVEVYVFDCNRISSVLRGNMTQDFQNLEMLTVADCCLVEEVFEYEELKNAGKEGHAAEALLPGLGVLKLHGLPKLTQIWKKQIRMNQDFRELSFIKIERCHGMKFLFSSSIVKNLVKLQILSISDCEMMEQVVEGEASELSGMMEFQNLKFLFLIGLPNLTSVYSGWLSFPSLEKIKLDNCRKMKMFSSSSFQDSEIYRSPLFGNQVTFPILKELQLSVMGGIEELWCSQIPTRSFQKLQVLKVLGCTKLVNIIPLHLLKVFSSLEELEISECDSLEEMFDSKGESIGEGHHTTLTSETLKSIKVERCDHIRNLFPSSVARGLVNLQRLQVESCPMIEDIFVEKADEDGGEDKTLFPALEIIKLQDLPSLKCFFDVNYAIQLPVLREVNIFNSYEMTTFSSSSVSTLKLDNVECVLYDDGRWTKTKIWKGDLNKTIEHIFEDTHEPESEGGSEEMEDGVNEMEDGTGEIEVGSDKIEDVLG